MSDRTEGTVWESTGHHGRLIETWAQAFWEADANGVVVTDSPSWRDYTGQSLEEWLGYGWLDAVHPDDRAYAERQWREAVAARDPVSAEFRLHAPDGGWRWTNVRAVPVLDREGGVEKWVGMNIDITERKQAEFALRTSEERYRTVFESIDEGFCIVETVRDAHDRLVDLIYREANAAYSRHAGFQPHPGLRVKEVAPEIEEEWIAFYDRVSRTGISETKESFNRDLRRWFRTQASRIGPDGSPLLGIVFEDVTERKRIEAAVRESEERQAVLLKLSDALRPLRDAIEIQETAMRLLGQHLCVSRAGYYGVEADQNAFFLTARWECEAIPLPDRMLITDFGDDIREGYLAGRTMVARDTEQDAATYDNLAAVRAVRIRAWIGVPLVKEGRWVAAVGVHSTSPRDWTSGEIGLVEEVGERTWAAVARAEAEAGVRAGEEERRSLITEMSEGFCILEVILDDAGNGVDYRFLETNPAFVRQGGFDPAGRLMSEIAPIEPIWPATYGRVATTGVPERIVDAAASFGRTYDVYAFRIGRAADRRIAVFFSDITARTSAEEALRDSEERQAFLLKLSDALRPLEDAGEIERAAVDLLGEHLGASRVFYATVAADGESWSVRHDYAAGCPSAAGTYPFNDFQRNRLAEWQAGRMSSVADSETEPTFTASDRAAYAMFGARAAIGVPLIRAGRFAALLAVNQIDARGWTKGELTLVRETAERTWTALERARAEVALRESEERFRQFGEASQDVLWIRDARTFQWEYLTPAFETIYGLNCEDALVGDNMAGWLDLIVPEDRAMAAACLHRVRDGEWVTFEYRVRRPVDGELRWLRNTDFPIRDGSGEVVRIGGIGHDVTELKHVEEALGAAEVRQRALVEGMPQLIWRAVGAGEWTWASPQWTEFTGQAEPDSHAWGWLAPLHPDDRPKAREAWAAADGQGYLDAEYRICHAGHHEYRWFHTRASPVRNGGGAIVEWLGTSTDIHELRDMQERQAVLVAELQHRTRNLMGVIRSVADKTGRASADLPDFRGRFRDRLDALARVQGLLSRLNEHDRVTFDELISTELEAMNGNAERVTVEGPKGVRLRSSMVQTLAMAVHELATNAVKYGALGQRNARLALRWTLEPEGQGGQPWLHFDWQESGVAMPPAGSKPRGSGQGRELIERALPYQLSARTTYELGPDGVHCTISLPVSTTTVGKEPPHA